MAINEQYYHTTFDEMNIRYQPFLEKMSNTFNTSLNTISIAGLYSTLTTALWRGKTIPVSTDDLDNMRHLFYFTNLIRHSANFTKAVNTPKFQLMFSRFEERITNKSQLRWTMLSAHDTDILPMLNSLNISSASCIE